MNRSPTISVLMPVYNAESYVAEATESILRQTFSDFEFLIIDDGATDRSRSILEQYASRDGRIRLVSRPNTGYARALNEMIGMARGDLLARMDADDISLPDRFEKEVRFLSAHPNVVAVGGAYEIIDEKGRYIRCVRPSEDDETLQRSMLAGDGGIMHPTAMMRRTVVAQVGGYAEDTVPAESIDLFLRMGEIGQLANLPDALIRYRVHGKSQCAVHRERQVAVVRSICERAWRRRGIEGHFEHARCWRPGDDRASRQESMLEFGWWAFNSGQRRTAMIYGAKAVGCRFWKPAGWRLLACAALKRMPRLGVPAST